MCGEHDCPTDQCDDFKHARDGSPQQAWVKGLALGLELALERGVSVAEREEDIRMLLRMIRDL